MEEVATLKSGANPSLERLQMSEHLTESLLECKPGKRRADCDVDITIDHPCTLIQFIFFHDDPSDVSISMYAHKKFKVEVSEENSSTFKLVALRDK